MSLQFWIAPLHYAENAVKLFLWFPKPAIKYIYIYGLAQLNAPNEDMVTCQRAALQCLDSPQ